MSLQLTRPLLRSTYKFLCTTEPFCDWNMPDADDIVFKVMKSTRNYGWHTSEGRRNRRAVRKQMIAVSGNVVGHTLTLIETMAHEMLHLYLDHHLIEGKNAGEHSAAFKKLAHTICKFHGFDYKRF